MRTISWLAVFMSLLSAFSLSRRLARVYAAIFGLAPLARSQIWRGLVWIVLQVGLFVAASMPARVRRDSGVLARRPLPSSPCSLLWFVADVAGLRLLVPKVPRRGSSRPRPWCRGWAVRLRRVGGRLHAAGPRRSQALQYGPIGVTFAIFTYILAGVLVYVVRAAAGHHLGAWRAERRAVPSAVE